MSGHWTRHPLPHLQESLQAHWLRTIGACDQVTGGAGWIPVRLRLSPKGVRTLLAFLDPDQRAEIAAPSASAFSLRILLASIQIAQETLAVLKRAASPGEKRDVEIDILVNANIEDRLWNQVLAGSPDFSIIDVGLARPVNTSAALCPKPDNGDNDAHLKEAKVIIAIVDDGLAFANPRFRLSARETRIEYFYAMETLLRDPPDGSFTAQCFDKEKIDAWLSEHGDDEEAIYRCAGLLNAAVDRRQPLWLSASHGTHVLDIAAGYDLSDPKVRETARNFPIVAVQLPTGMVEDTSGTNTEADLRAALTKIDCLARELSRRAARQRGTDQSVRLPLIVNFSFGVFAGRKDGYSKIAKHVRDFTKDYRDGDGGAPCHVVVPAGNGFQARTIGRLELAGGVEETVEWRVLPDDKTASFLHIWLPKRAVGEPQQVSVSLIPPRDGPDTTVHSAIGHYLDWERDGIPFARIYHHEAGPGNPGMMDDGESESREHILLALRPTETDCNEPHLSPAGLWRIRVRNCGTSTLNVDLMVQRDDTIGDRRRSGRQSYLESHCYHRYHPVSGRFIVEDDPECPPIRRQGSLNAYAASCDPIVVGGYRWTDGTAADYTASGPVPSGRRGPDLAAISETSPSHRGVLAAGTYAHAVKTQRGTSVAAPALVRALAAAMAEGRGLESLMDKLRDRENTPIRGPHEPYAKLTDDDRKRLGVGRLEPASSPPNRRRIEA